MNIRVADAMLVLVATVVLILFFAFVVPGLTGIP